MTDSGDALLTTLAVSIAFNHQLDPFMSSILGLVQNLGGVSHLSCVNVDYPANVEQLVSS
jgi:hypothetical protein